MIWLSFLFIYLFNIYICRSLLLFTVTVTTLTPLSLLCSNLKKEEKGAVKKNIQNKKGENCRFMHTLHATGNCFLVKNLINISVQHDVKSLLLIRLLKAGLSSCVDVKNANSLTYNFFSFCSIRVKRLFKIVLENFKKYF